MKPNIRPLLFSILLFLVGIIAGVLASKYLPVFKPLFPEAICQKGGYQDVRSCGGYFIANKPCCDQGADVWNGKNQIVVRCGGWGAPPGMPKSECEKLLKTIDTRNCQELTCSLEDAKKAKPPYSLWEQPLLFIRQLLSRNTVSRAISIAVKVTPTSPFTDLTASWKTYLDNRFNFSVKYPDDWNIIPFPGKWESEAWLILAYSPDSKTGTVKGEIVGVVEGQSTSFSVSAYDKLQVTIRDLESLALEKNSKKTEQTINQIKGLLIVNEERFSAIEKLFIFEKENYTFVIQLFWRKGKPEDEKTLDQILSTFTFSDQTNPEQNCEINYTYENTAVNPVACQCPPGYEKNVVEITSGPCPKPEMQDCPQTKFKCIKEK